MDEIWKEIPGTKGYYSVSNLGRARSNDREIKVNQHQKKYFKKGQILKPWIGYTSGNYETVALKLGAGKQIKVSVHRLVAWTFIGKQPKGMDVRHLDGNCKNNNLSNLCYGTRKQNIHDAIKHGSMKPKPKKLTSDQVIEICKMGRDKISSKIVGEKYSISRSTVTEIWRGQIWQQVTKGILPQSNINKKYHLLTDDQKAILLDNTRKIIDIARDLNISRKTCREWRKRFSS